jgi:archaellum component FlaG (FlaF/FlaG flagellin family)
MFLLMQVSRNLSLEIQVKHYLINHPTKVVLDYIIYLTMYCKNTTGCLT